MRLDYTAFIYSNFIRYIRNGHHFLKKARLNEMSPAHSTGLTSTRPLPVP